jgi:signal transduction histidine kinase
LSDYEIDLSLPQHGLRTLSISASLMRDQVNQPTAIVYLARDITERKRAAATLQQHAEQLEALSHRLVQVQENERRLIAADLHDSVVQWLSGTLLKVELVKRSLAKGAPAEAHEELIEIEANLQRSIRELRSTILRLHPPELQRYGLVTSLGRYVEQWRKQTGIQTQVELAREPAALPLALKTGLYRIAQEALNNVAKHAQASGAKIQLEFEPSLARLQIQDDGVGFDSKRLYAGEGLFTYPVDDGNESHLGLIDMYERSLMLGGHLALKSEPGQGTCITVTVPIDQSTQGRV